MLDPTDAIVTTGPNNQSDAFILQRQFSAPTSGVEWEQIGTGLRSEFGIYTVFDTTQYTGSIITITNEINSMLLLDITIQPSANSLVQNTLTFTLPGLGQTFEIDIHTASADRPFQDIGISFRNSILGVLLNCNLSDFKKLPSAPDQLSTDNGRVTIFGDQATVSFFAIECV